MSGEQGYDTNSLRSTLAQTLAAVGFSIYCVNIGLIHTMPTIIIGDLTNQDSSLGLSETQASWFGSLYYIMQPFGSLVSGILQDSLGRKRSVMMINLPQLTAWAILYFSSSPTHLYVSIALMGLSIGFLEAPILSYIGEVTQPRLRGVFSSFMGIFYNAGLMVETFLGASLPWRTMVLWNMIGPLVAFFAMAMLPESPAWLVTRGKIAEAEKAYQWLRGWVSTEAVKEELDTLVRYVGDFRGHSVNSPEYRLVAPDEGPDITRQKRCNNRWKVIMEPEVRTAFRIILVFFSVVPFASLFAMRPFFIQILEGLNLPVQSHIIVAICGAVSLLGAVTLGVSVKHLGKRYLTFLSLGANIVCIYGIGGYLLAGINLPWIPVVLFSLTYFFGTIVATIPWMYLIELFPLRARSLGSGLGAAYAYVVFFAGTKTYFNVVSWLNVSGTCILYGTVGLLGMVYLYLDLPETEGQTLEHIEMDLRGRRSGRRGEDDVRVEAGDGKRQTERE
ncbi:facilitated trehalose transporter Tret1-like [Macrosteles quadrilineatus]|uniref:facilitated trehalose transporter Tret1-like n=1 Tax=Macrosteles quadrilineatus TaxID=74068 RepID=UPI0023E20BFA|nr:facilitated trehalose transporter Tret1-like [Macrosteles quadrilineatus]